MNTSESTEAQQWLHASITQQPAERHYINWSSDQAIWKEWVKR